MRVFRFSLPLCLSASLAVLSLFASEAVAQNVSPQAICGGDGTAADYEIGIRVYDGEHTIRLWDVATGTLVDQRQATTTPVYGSCSWVGFYDNLCSGTNNPLCVRFEPNTLYRLDIGDLRSFYYYNCIGGTPAGSFFCPRGSTGPSPDVNFYVRGDFVRVVPGVNYLRYNSTKGVDDYAPSGWVLPYDVTTICNAGGCDPGRNPENDENLVFLTPADDWSPGTAPAGLPISVTTSSNADWRVLVSRTYRWSSSDVSAVRFGTNGRLGVKGQLNTTGLTLTAANTTQGWSGVRFAPGSDGSITGGFIGNVRAGAAVSISGASPTISGVTIQNGSADGISVTGNASPLLAGNVIDGGGGVGIQVASSSGNARVKIRDNIIQRNAAGISIDFNGRADIAHNTVGGSPTNRNTGVGVQVTYGSTVSFSGYPDDGQNTITFNAGAGLLAQHDYTLVRAGAATSARDNSLFRNGQAEARYPDGEGPDAASFEGALLTARYNWWGRPTDPDTTTGDLGGNLISDDPNAGMSGGGATYGASRGMLFVDPMLAQAPGGAARAARGDNFSSEGEDAPDDESPRALVLAAAEAKPAEALVLLSPALDDGGETVTRVALGQLARLCADDGAGAAAEALLRARGDEAQRALVGCLTLAGRDDEALALLSAPSAQARGAARGVAGTPASDLYASLAAFQIHLGRGALADAQAALTRALAAAPSDAGALAAARAFAAVSGDPGRLEAIAQQARQTRLAADDAQRAADLAALADGPLTLDAARPNPATGRAVVPFTLGTAADVDVVALDVLGRVVARLAAGPYAAGRHEAVFDAASLPAGTYLVRVRAAGAGGRTEATQRVTVRR